MEGQSSDAEVIKVIIVDDDGNETEVDANCIKLEISNTEDFESLEDDIPNENEASGEETELLDNIKVELVEDPVHEFGEFILSQNLEEYSEQEYFHQYIENEETNPTRKRKRGRPSSFEPISKRSHVCSVCGYTSYQKSHFRRHIAIHSRKEGIFCSICRKEMSGKIELNEHMEEHKSSYDPSRYECHMCSYSSKKLTNVSQHTEIHFKPKKSEMQCEHCDFKTTNQVLFKKHKLSHADGRKNMRCPVCLVLFKSMMARRKHLQKYKNGPDPSKYQCPECSYKTFKFNNFKQHMVVHRNEYEIEMFQCSHCPFKSKRKTDLRQHVIVKHKSKEEVMSFRCDFCSYESRRGNHLSSHMKNRHTKDIVYKKCGLCSYRTVSQVLIDKHCSIHSKIPEQFFLCTICGSGFVSRKLLDEHLEKCRLISDDDGDYSLSEEEVKVKKPKVEENPDQGYSFELSIMGEDSSQKELTAFYCCQFPQCNFKTWEERDAKIHRTISHNKRGEDNRCPECTFHTTSRYLYLDHLKVHQIDIEHLKSHLCEVCGTRWIRQGDLTRHMSVHWGNEERRKNQAKLTQDSDKALLSCTYCSYTTRLRLCLFKHMAKHGDQVQKEYIMKTEQEVSEINEYQKLFDSYSEESLSDENLHQIGIPLADEYGNIENITV